MHFSVTDSKKEKLPVVNEKFELVRQHHQQPLQAVTVTASDTHTQVQRQQRLA